MAKRRTRLWLLPVMLAAAGFCYLDNCTVQTTFRTLRCATLPEAFSGLRIVQISDLHGCVFGKEHAALLSAVRPISSRSPATWPTRTRPSRRCGPCSRA